jgi:hypothetical protein
LIQVVNEAYRQADVDRQMLERSLELSSEELGDANANLRRAVTDLRAAHGEMEQRVLPVLFMSGHADLDPATFDLGRPGTDFLPKPIQAASITAEIRGLLAAAT